MNKRAGLASTLRDGATRRVGAVAADNRATAGVMDVVKRCKRSVRARRVSSRTVANVVAGSGLDSALARVLAVRVATSNKEGAGMTHWCGKNCKFLAKLSARVFGTYTQ